MPVIIVAIAVTVVSMIVLLAIVMTLPASQYRNTLGQLRYGAKHVDRSRVAEDDEDSPRMLWVQPLFIPHRNYIGVLSKIIESLQEYGKDWPEGHRVDVICGGYVYDNTWRTELEKLWPKDTSSGSVHFIGGLRYFDRNYGQAYTWNWLMDQHDVRSYDCVILTGARGVLLPTLSPTLRDTARVLHVDKTLGAISLGLARYHMTRNGTPIDTHVVQERNSYHELRLLRPDNNRGIAGSVTVFAKRAMEYLDYHIFASNVYCSDDAVTHKRLLQGGLAVGVAVSHPVRALNPDVPTNAQFIHWKQGSLREANTRQFRDATMEELMPWVEGSEEIFAAMNGEE